MSRTIRRPAALGLVMAGALALSLAAAPSDAATSPASAGHITYTTAAAGYQVAGARDFNDVRAVASFDGGTANTSQVNVLLQHGEGVGPTAQLSLVYSGHIGSWTLMWGYSATGTAPGLTTAIPIWEGGGYLEIHYSTSTHQLVFLAGSSARTASVEARVSGVTASFTAPAVEVGPVFQPATALPIGMKLANFQQVGVTQLLTPRSPTSPTLRATLAAESPDTLWATVTGNPPTPDNSPTLVPSSLGAGSAFTVTAAD